MIRMRMVVALSLTLFVSLPAQGSPIRFDASGVQGISGFVDFDDAAVASMFGFVQIDGDASLALEQIVNGIFVFTIYPVTWTVGVASAYYYGEREDVERRE